MQKENKIVDSIEKFIDDELQLLNAKSQIKGLPSSKEKFLVYKQAFMLLLDQLKIYKGLLVSIKKEYENSISDLETNSCQLELATDSLGKLFDNSVTIRNLEKRQAELNAKLEVALGENYRLKEELDELNKKTAQFKHNTPQYLLSLKENEQTNNKNKNVAELDKKSLTRLINQMSMERATDLEYLEDLIKRIEAKIEDLNMNQGKKFSNKDVKQNLHAMIFEKSNAKDEAMRKCELVRKSLMLYNKAYQIVNDYYENGRSNSPYTSVEEDLIKNLIHFCIHHRSNLIETDQDGVTFSSIDAEADLILDFIEKFNDLLDQKKFTEAACLAAVSPKNILRNLDTFYRFKQIRDEFNLFNNEDEDPLLTFCTAIVDSYFDSQSKPNKELSLECIRIILEYNKIDILTRWISQRKLTLSLEAANQITDYAQSRSKFCKNSFELALFIYDALNEVASFNALICLANLGRIQQLTETIKSQNIDLECCLQLLCYYPKIELALFVTDQFKSSSEINVNVELIESITSVLLDFNPDDGLKYLKSQIDTYTTNVDEKGREKLKASYDILTKHAYLVKEQE